MCSILKIIFFVYLSLQIFDKIAYALPVDLSEKEYMKEDVQYCYKDSEHLVTCQRCAKQTKSPIVYPLCCTNREQALQWCQEYTKFGLHHPEFKRDLMKFDR